MKHYKHRSLDYIPDAILTAFRYVFAAGAVAVVVYYIGKWLYKCAGM